MLPQEIYLLSLFPSMLPWWLSDRESACQWRRHRFNPWSEKIPWRNGNPLQYSYLENPTVRGAWRATAHGDTQSWTRFNDWTSLTSMKQPEAELINYSVLTAVGWGGHENKQQFTHLSIRGAGCTVTNQPIKCHTPQLAICIHSSETQEPSHLILTLQQFCNREVQNLTLLWICFFDFNFCSSLLLLL